MSRASSPLICEMCGSDRIKDEGWRQTCQSCGIIQKKAKTPEDLSAELAEELKTLRFEPGLLGRRSPEVVSPVHQELIEQHQVEQLHTALQQLGLKPKPMRRPRRLKAGRSKFWLKLSNSIGDYKIETTALVDLQGNREWKTCLYYGQNIAEIASYGSKRAATTGHQFYVDFLKNLATRELMSPEEVLQAMIIQRELR